MLDFGSSLNEMGTPLPLVQERMAAKMSLSPLLWGEGASLPVLKGSDIGFSARLLSSIDRFPEVLLRGHRGQDLIDLLTGVNNLITEMKNWTG
jgi:hypothetical protein